MYRTGGEGPIKSDHYGGGNALTPLHVGRKLGVNAINLFTLSTDSLLHVGLKLGVNAGEGGNYFHLSGLGGGGRAGGGQLG